MILFCLLRSVRWPDGRGMSGRISVQSIAGWLRNPQIMRENASCTGAHTNEFFWLRMVTAPLEAFFLHSVSRVVSSGRTVEGLTA